MIIRLTALLLLCASFAVHADRQAPLFEYEGKSYAVEDLSTRMQALHATVLQDHDRAMRTLVDEMLFDVYAEGEAARQQRPVREVGMELLDVAKPTDLEVRAFYEQIKTQINLPFEQISARLSAEMHRQRVLQHRAQLIARLKQEGNFNVLLPPPPEQVANINIEGRPLRGDPAAPITLVEFADYQCPKCKHAVNLFKELIEQFPRDIKLVFMDFPINRSGISKQIAWGASCAQSQGKFWDYHDAAFSAQASLNLDSPKALAEQLGLEMGTFNECMQSPETRRKIEASRQEGLRLGVNGTPSLFVDGRAFPTQDLPRDLGEYIAKKKAGKS